VRDRIAVPTDSFQVVERNDVALVVVRPFLVTTEAPLRRRFPASFTPIFGVLIRGKAKLVPLGFRQTPIKALPPKRLGNQMNFEGPSLHRRPCLSLLPILRTEPFSSVSMHVASPRCGSIAHPGAVWRGRLRESPERHRFS